MATDRQAILVPSRNAARAVPYLRAVLAYTWADCHSRVRDGSSNNALLVGLDEDEITSFKQLGSTGRFDR